MLEEVKDGLLKSVFYLSFVIYEKEKIFCIKIIDFIKLLFLYEYKLFKKVIILKFK